MPYLNNGTWVFGSTIKIKNIHEIELIFNNYYNEYIRNKLKLYTDRIDKLMNLCLINNKELYDLFNIVQKRSFTNIFRRNNTLSNLMKLYTIIYNMLINYSIENNTTDLKNYSCFYMLVNVFIFIKKMNHLNKYFKHDAILIELLVLIRQHILILAYAFLNKINSSYNYKYTEFVKKFPQTKSLVPEISPSLNVSQKKNKQKYYEDLIELYIQFFSMYNLINVFMNTFEIKTYSNVNSTQLLLDNLTKLYDNIFLQNKKLFRTYIQYLGKEEVGKRAETKYSVEPPNKNIKKEMNELIKGLYHQTQIR
jgi:hypothetical protein